MNIARQKKTAARVLASIIFSVLALFSSMGLAADKAPTYEELMSGLVLNHTITSIGQNFFKDFTSHWQPPQNLDDFTVSVVERFNPQWGSLVWVTVDDQVVFQRFLSARSGDKEDAAKVAVRDVQQYLLKRELFKQYMKSDDLHGDGY